MTCAWCRIRVAKARTELCFRCTALGWEGRNPAPLNQPDYHHLPLENSPCSRTSCCALPEGSPPSPASTWEADRDL
jgi:hypothetical protein